MRKREKRRILVSRWVAEGQTGRSDDRGSKVVATRDQLIYRQVVLATRWGGTFILEIPSLWTIFMDRYLRRAIVARGLKNVTIPAGVLSNAGIRGFEIVAQGDATKLRPPQVVIKAQTSHGYSRTREAYFLSGYDTEEFMSYFFCELPREVTSIEDAYESLKPEAVRIAERFGRKFKRQGDLYFIPAADQKNPAFARAVKSLTWMLGTNHASKWVVEIDGATYARGKVVHMPWDRDPDHGSVHLGKKWHLVVRNMVPITAS